MLEIRTCTLERFPWKSIRAWAYWQRRVIMSLIGYFCQRPKKRRTVSLIAVCAALICILTFSRQPSLDDPFDHKESEYHRRLRFQAGQVCIHPQLEANHSSVHQFFHDEKQLECPKDKNWVYVKNGTFYVTQDSKRRRGKVLCEYVPLYRGKDDYHTMDGQHIKPMHDGAPLLSDFFKVACVSQDQHRYFNIHSGIAYNSAAHARSSEIPLPASAMGYTVLMVGFDSVSRMTWMRQLPKTHSYFQNTLNGILLEGYNIVGDGTPQALLPILTGKTEEELPEARKGKPNATSVDKHPWVWKDFKKLGYITQWGEDMANIGTFTYRMFGFKEQPVDHYMRTFYLVAEKIYSHFKPYCLGSVARHVNFFNWLKDSFRMYGNKRKFMFGFHSEFSHGDSNKLQHADAQALDFLRFLQNGGFLDHTILIMMSDHGARFQDVRETLQGKLEERMPYFAFRFPPGFEEKYPLAMKNFRTNAYRLTTPFDIHETFMDILDYKNIEKGDLSQRGISLFREIPKERSCAHAGIQPHWCACLTWETVNDDDDGGIKAVMATVNFINSFVEPFRENCANLTLLSITRMVKYSTNNNMLRFKKSEDHDGRKADLSGKISSTETMYQVTFRTTPGNGHFEATVLENAEKTSYAVDEHEISRINKYGDDPACVMDSYPHLRPYCYCKSNIMPNAKT